MTIDDAARAEATAGQIQNTMEVAADVLDALACYRQALDGYDAATRVVHGLLGRVPNWSVDDPQEDPGFVDLRLPGPLAKLLTYDPDEFGMRRAAALVAAHAVEAVAERAAADLRDVDTGRG